MKSIKKRFKHRLAEIEQQASTLCLLTAELSLLDSLYKLSSQVLQVCEQLEQQASALNKTDFIEGMTENPGVIQLNEWVDADAMSLLEQQFFAAVDNHADSNIGEFLQQLLEKLEPHYTQMVNNIQQLSGLLDET